MLISLHPRTLDRLKHFGIDLGAHIRVMKPLGFFDFVRLETDAACVLSDSGTVQEECCIFGVPNVTNANGSPCDVASGSQPFLSDPRAIYDPLQHRFWAAMLQVEGGLGIAPGGNIGDGFAVFEATHGTAPKYADKDVINPGSVILSGVMLFDFLGWTEAARLIESSMEKTIAQKFVTYDFERQMQGATKAKTSEFATRMIENMG